MIGRVIIHSFDSTSSLLGSGFILMSRGLRFVFLVFWVYFLVIALIVVLVWSWTLYFCCDVILILSRVREL